MREIVFSQENLDVKEAYVEELIVENDSVCGVILEGNEKNFSI